jgi:adenine deaminase
MNSLSTARPSNETGIDAFVRGIPKAELHLHIEGTLEPEMVSALARKHGIRLRYDSVDGLREGYQFGDLQSFLDLYYQCADVLRHEDDFFTLTLHYLRRARQDGVVHCEIFFDPQTHTDRGIPFAAVVHGIRRALDEGMASLGISSRLIMCFLRHLSADAAMQTLESALPYRDAIFAVGLDSSERGNPPAKFAEVFRRARGLGFEAVAHAGEEGPPSYIEEAIDVLKVSRIDHGIACEQDDTLCRRLAATRMPLTMCPLSNVKLGVFKSLAEHNLKRLLDRGLCVTVSSDDPAYFGGYVGENLLAAQRALGLDRHDIAKLAANSITASFLIESRKRAWIAGIETYAAVHSDRTTSAGPPSATEDRTA